MTKDYKSAEKHIVNAIEVYKENLAHNHIDMGWAFVNLGYLYKDLKRYKEAKSYLHQGLEIYTTHLGAEHLDTASIWSTLGDIYLEEGAIEKAETYFQNALKINRANQSPETQVSLERSASLDARRLQG